MINISEIPIFASLDQGQINSLENIITIKKYEKGQTIFLEGDSSEFLYIIITGQVQIIKSTRDGKEKIIAIVGDGDFFGEMGILEKDKRSATAKCNKNSNIIVIEKNDFLRLIKNNPQIALRMMTELSHRLRRAGDDIKNLSYYIISSYL